MTIQKINRISETLVNRLATLSITGGEPFLRDDLVEIVEAFVKNNLTRKVNIATNGFFTKKIVKVVREILEKKKFSIDFNIELTEE
jgi:molybdenum cofactor biosynthesis enzyme MoaA